MPSHFLLCSSLLVSLLIHASALEIWQLLDSAQLPDFPSISHRDPDLPARPSSPVAPLLLPLAPTGSLYNRAIQALCVAGKRTTQPHAQAALALFQRMVQQGLCVRTTTYARLMTALSEWGTPNSSGLQFVFEQLHIEAQAVEQARKEQEQHAGTKRNRVPSPYEQHPELATFRVQTFAFEAMLFALLRSPLAPSSSSSSSSSYPSSSSDLGPAAAAPAAAPATPSLSSKQLLDLVRVRVEDLLSQMAALGLAHSQAVFNSRMLLAIFSHRPEEAQLVWDQMAAASQHHIYAHNMRARQCTNHDRLIGRSHGFALASPLCLSVSQISIRIVPCVSR